MKKNLGLHVNVEVRKGRIPPEILYHQADQQLIKDWDNGITCDDAEKRIRKTKNNIG